MADLNLNGIDYIVLILLLVSVILGIKRGFIKEIIALLSWVAAFLVSSLFATDVAGLFTPHAVQTQADSGSSASLLALGISYLLLFVGTLLCGQFIEYLLSYAIEGRGVSIVNRLLGSFFGLIRGWFVILLIMFVISLTSLEDQPLWKESKTVSAFKPAVSWLNDVAQPYLNVLQSKMKEAGKKASQELSPEVIKGVVKPAEPAANPAGAPAPTPGPAPAPAPVPESTPAPANPSDTAPVPVTPANPAEAPTPEATPAPEGTSAPDTTPAPASTPSTPPAASTPGTAETPPQ